MMIGCFTGMNAQDWNWGANEKMAKQNWNVFEQKMIEKDYVLAQGPCSWLLKNAPEASKNLYIDASKVYEGLVKLKTSELGKKSPVVAALQDTALMIYDQRIKYFGEEAYVLDRKGTVAYKYLAQRDGELDGLYNLYSKIVDLNNTHTTAVNLTNYMKVGILRYKSKVLSKDEVLKLYLSLEDIIEAEIKETSTAGQSVKYLDKNKVKIEETFSKYVTLDCQDIHKAYEAKFETEPTIENAQKIFSSMAGQSCTSDELFLKATEYLLANKPEYKYYQILSSVYFNEKKYEEAYKMYEQGMTLTTDSTQKAEAYYSMAQLDQRLNKYAQARNNANKSIALGSDNTAAYNLIGNMYESSYSSCKSEDLLASKAIFIAAYNMYAQAGNSERMAEMKKMFPTVSEMFMQNTKEGEVVKVGCWMNMNVVLKKQ